MSNVMRHRYGAKNPVLVQVASGTVVEVGDLIALVSGYGKTFFQIAGAGRTNASMADCVQDFAGVVMQASASGETTPIRVATTGTFEYPCVAASVYTGYFANINSSALAQKVAVATSINSLTMGAIFPNNTGGVGVGAGQQTSCLVRIYTGAFGPKMDSAA